MSDWSDDEIATLRRLTGEGLSATRIGVLMGRGRNSIIGKVHRLNGAGGTLKGPSVNKGDDMSKKKAGHLPRREPPRKEFSTPKPPVFERPQPYVPAVNLPATLPIAFLAAVDSKRCLHFVGDPFGPDGPDMPVCGAERSEGTAPYCRRHLASAVKAVPA